MLPILTIAIPTHNRAHLLAQCLGWLLPQVPGDGSVEVLVVDNGSSDATGALLQNASRNDPRVCVARLPENRGYAGSQMKCIETARGEYIAFLCDDDLYLPGQVERLLAFLPRGPYCLMAMNYISFRDDPTRPDPAEFAPDEDRIFARGLDLMNHPSVGHYSGLACRRDLAQRALAELMREFDPAYYNRARGIISEIAPRCAAGSNLPAAFMGARGVAARTPHAINYDRLQHLCHDYLVFQYDLRRKGISSDQDFAYRAGLVESWLPMAILHDAHLFDSGELRAMRLAFDRMLGQCRGYRTRSRPLLRLGEQFAGLWLLSALSLAIRLLKRILRRPHARGVRVRDGS